jgi:hypothetical protein
MLTGGMLLAFAACGGILSLLIFSDLASARAILCGDTLMIDQECLESNPGWTQVNFEFRNLSLSSIQLQGAEVNCEVNLGKAVPFSIPPLSKCKLQSFVTKSRLNGGMPIVFFVDGKRLELYAQHQAVTLAKAVDLETNELLENGQKPLTSILEN